MEVENFLAKLGDFGNGGVFNKCLVIVGAASFFQFVNVASGLLFRTFFNNKWDSMNAKNRELFTTTLSSTAHLSFTLPLVTKLVFFNTGSSGTINLDRMLGYSSLASGLFTTSAGFFLWDFVTLLRNPDLEYDYLLHHFACFVSYLLVNQPNSPFIQYHALRLLLFESSTPFLNIRFIMIALDLDKKPDLAKYYNLIQVLFVLIFIAVRIFYGVPISINAFRDVYHSINTGQLKHVFAASYLTVANLGMTCLNLYWGAILFKKMIKGLRQLFWRNGKKE